MTTPAVVAGTADAVHRRQEQRYKAMRQQPDYEAQQAAYNSQARVNAMPAQQAAQAAVGSTSVGGSDEMAQLQQLPRMQAAGLLTTE